MPFGSVGKGHLRISIELATCWARESEHSSATVGSSQQVKCGRNWEGACRTHNTGVHKAPDILYCLPRINSEMLRRDTWHIRKVRASVGASAPMSACFDDFL